MNLLLRRLLRLLLPRRLLMKLPPRRLLMRRPHRKLLPRSVLMNSTQPRTWVSKPL